MSSLPYSFALFPDAASLPGSASRRDRLWDDCRNCLGIARLLVHEGRAAALVATACRMAVEVACRAALEITGFPYDGDVTRALSRLSAPQGLWSEAGDSGPERLAAAEKTVGWLAAYLRSEAPDRSWGF